MGKIKMRTIKRTIKLRDNKKTAQQAFRRRNIKALKKSVEPTQPEQAIQETQEAQAVDEITEVAVPALQRVGVFPRSVQQRAAQQKPKAAQQKSAQRQEYTEMPTPAPEGQAPVHAAQTTQASGTTSVSGAASRTGRVETTIQPANEPVTMDTPSEPVPFRQQGPRTRTAREAVKESTQAPAAPNDTQAPILQTAKQPTTAARNQAASEKTVPTASNYTTGTFSLGAESIQNYAPEIKETPSPKEPRRTLRQKSATISRAQPQGTQTTKAAQAKQATKAAQAAQMKKAAQTAQVVQSAKKAGKSEQVAKALKAAVQAVGKTVGNALGAMGGAAGLLAPLLVIVLIGGLLASPLGLFFSAETEGKMTLQQAMARLNTEFSDRITEIENSVAHDEVQQSGQRVVWKEILTIYAVKTTTDPENPLDAMTMDEDHFVVLQQIFWDMNTIEYTTETYTEKVTVEVPTEDSNDEDGITEETQTVEKTRLLITITSKTAQQMAEEYGFNKEQLGYVTELLSEEYAELWAMLAVPGVGSDNIVAVALSQVGNVGGEPYWSWYGFSSRVSWCACFVSWCGDQCGYIESGVMPKFSYCDAGIAWFKSRDQWQSRGYCPSPGDIIFFDWNNNGVADHVGIVESCDGSYVYTIEGNANDAVKRLCYSVNYSGIKGYGILVY